MSKRIFQAKAEAVLPVANSRTPNCYYHKFPITQFCVKSTACLQRKVHFASLLVVPVHPQEGAH